MGPQFEELSRRVISSGNGSREVIAPATGEPLGTVPESTPDDVTEAVDTAREKQAQWAEVPVETRATIIEQFSEGM